MLLTDGIPYPRLYATHPWRERADVPDDHGTVLWLDSRTSLYWWNHRVAAAPAGLTEEACLHWYGPVHHYPLTPQEEAGLRRGAPVPNRLPWSYHVVDR